MTTITNVADNTSPAFNLSIYPYVFATETLKPIGDGESCIKKYTALIGAEACFLLGTIIGTIETVFWTAIFLLAKTVHVFIPKSFEMPTEIAGWIFARSEIALLFTIASATAIVLNFFKSTNELAKFNTSITNPIENGLKACKDVINFQLFDGTPVPVN